MPKVMVGGKMKHFPYTAKGMKAAAEARMKAKGMMSEKEMRQRMKKKRMMK